MTHSMSCSILFLCCVVVHGKISPLSTREILQHALTSRISCLVAAQSSTMITIQLMSQAVTKLSPSVTPSVTPTGAPGLPIPLWMIIVIAVVFGVTVLFALVWWSLVRLKQLIIEHSIYCLLFHCSGLLEYVQKKEKEEE